MAFQNHADALRHDVKNVSCRWRSFNRFKPRATHAARPDVARASAACDRRLGALQQDFPGSSRGCNSAANLCRALVHDRICICSRAFRGADAFTREELWVVNQALWMRQRFTAMSFSRSARGLFPGRHDLGMSKGPAGSFPTAR